VQVAGAIATVTLTAGGAGYANGTYSQQALTGGTGTGATADIVVAGGIATSCVVRSPGTGYAAADALSCATIGAGAGFVATVATIAQTVNGSGNLTALGRIGAGTATPRAALDVVGGVWVNGFEPTNAPNAYSQSTGILSFSRSFATIRAGVQTFDASVAGTSTINSVSATPILTNLAGSYQGIQISPLILSSSGSGLVTGCSFRHLRTTSGDLATPTVLGSTVNFQAVAGAASAASYNYSTINGFQFAHNFNAAGTTVDLAAFNAYPITLALGHVVTTAYGLRLQAASISGGASITNRWGISQEDTLAKNYFAGNVGIGTAIPAAGRSLTTAADCDIFGLRIGRGLLPEVNSTALGAGALNATVAGALYNTAAGASAGSLLTTGQDNTLAGFQTGFGLTSGNSNAYCGTRIASASISSASFNAVLGAFGLRGVTTGGSNTVIGYVAAAALTTGTSNIIIGAFANTSGAAVTNEIVIGASVTGAGSNTTTIGTTATTKTVIPGGNVGIGTPGPTAALHLPAGTTARASLNITSGAAPTAPNNGDIWFDGTNIFMRIGGVTKTFTLV
jgi:hypothetical protein